MNLKEYRPDIDGIRALAILLVVIFHFDENFLSGGFIGVDIFFVISGFVISNNILNEIAKTQKFSLINFYHKRIKRLFPALFVMVNLTLIYALASNYFLLKQANEKLIDNAISAILGVANFFFIAQQKNYFIGGSENELLLHSWSLSLEEQFYLLFSLLIIFKLIRKNLTLVISALAILSLIFAIFCAQKYPLEGFYLPITRCYEFIIGILIAKLQFDKKLNFTQDELIAKRFAIIGICLVFLSALLFSLNIKMPSYYALFPCLGTGFLIIAGFNKNISIYKFLSAKPITFIGKISYSLYLYHLPILVFSVGLLNPIWQIFIITFFAIFSYYFIENNFRYHLFFSAKKIVYPFLILNLAIILTLKFSGDFFVKNDSKKYIVTKGIPADGGCFYEFNEKFSKERIDGCLKYNPAKKNILLFGDSHAAAFAKTFDDVAKNNDVNLMKALGSLCAPIFDLKRDYKAMQRESCELNNAYLKQKIISKELKIDLVIMVAKWHKHDFYLKSRFDELQNTIDFFKKHQIKVIIFGDVPTFLENIADRNVKTKFISYKMIDQGYLQIDKEMREYLRKEKYVKYYSGFDFFCSNLSCRVISDENEILYFDRDHLSYEGGNLVFSKIEQEFLRLINNK